MVEADGTPVPRYATGWIERAPVGRPRHQVRRRRRDPPRGGARAPPLADLDNRDPQAVVEPPSPRTCSTTWTAGAAGRVRAEAWASPRTTPRAIPRVSQVRR
ncbi:hypothetical protein QJS66_15875 [Kocuria rhizophila]|nr:hypothetical protein QJS66_15875 [Kocuria rhizophila]